MNQTQVTSPVMARVEIENRWQATRLLKDAQGRIKRQAARFRLFGYDSKGKLVKEITSKDASICWTAHLANKKAAWKRFVGLNPNSPLRNASVTDRKSLLIDPGPRSLSGPNKTASFDTGTFLGSVVPLGEMRTDRQGRLLVLGGFGNAGSPIHAPFDAPGNDFANRDGWYDDVCDGDVRACLAELPGRRPPSRRRHAVLLAQQRQEDPRLLLAEAG